MRFFTFTFKPPYYPSVVGVKVSTADLLEKRAPVPGLLIFSFSGILTFGSIQLYSSNISWPLAVCLYITLGVMSCFLGNIYNNVKVRKFVDNLERLFFTEKIKKILFESGETIKISIWKKNKIINSSKIMDIFYDFVDCDDFLREIYIEYISNKFYLIIFYDIIIISFVFSIFSSFMIFIFKNSLFYLCYMSFCSFIFFISFFIYEKLYNKNIMLSRQQIDFIIIRYEKDLKNKIYELYF